MARPPPNPVFTLKGHMEPVHCLLFDLREIEELIYAGTQKGNIHLWDLKINRELKLYKIGEETCLSIHKMEPDNQIVTQDKNAVYKIWLENTKTKEWILRRTIYLDYIGFSRCVVDIENRFIVCPISNSGITVIYVGENVNKKYNEINNDGLCSQGNNNLENEKSIGSINGIQSERDNLINEDSLAMKCDKEITFKCDGDVQFGEVMSVKCVNNLIIVAYEIGIIKIWCLVTRNCVVSESILKSCPMALDIHKSNCSNDVLFGYIGSTTDIITEFNFETSKNILTKKREIKITNVGVSSIEIRSDNKIFAAGCWDKRIRLFSCKTLKLLVVLDFHKDIIQDISFSCEYVKSWSCHYLMAAGGSDGKVSLWDLYNS